MPKKVKVKIEGAIVPNDSKWIYTWFGIDATCPKDVEDVLNTIEDTNDTIVEVVINSGGGDVFAGSEIYTLLKSYPGRVEGVIPSIAASAASFAGMACNPLRIAPTAQIMIHNAKSGAHGDHRDMRDASSFLRGWDKSICNAYILKTGMTQEKLLGLMDNETWMTAQKAKEYGFVDEILFDDENRLVASNEPPAFQGMLPEQVINKMRALIAQHNGSLPEGNDYRTLLNQKGDVPMNLEAILAKLSEEEQKVILDAIDAAKVEASKEAEAAAEKTFSEERTQLQNEIDELRAKLPTESETEDSILKDADPKIRAIVEAARKSEAAAQAKLQAIEDQKELDNYIAIAASFDKLPIDSSKFGPVFRNFAKADSEGFEELKALLTAADNAITDSKLFNTTGTSSGAAGTQTAWAELESKIKAAMEKDSSLTRQDAMLNAFKTDPTLYNRYLKEMGTHGDESADE